MLLNFLLSKRNITKGGVDYYYSPIEFSLEELEMKYLIDETSLRALLSGLQTERVDVQRYGKIVEKTLFDSFDIGNGVAKVLNCTTEKLKLYYDYLKSDYREDYLTVDEKNRTVTDIEGHKHTFRRGKYKNRWFLFHYLYRESDSEGGVAKTYEEIFKELYTGKLKNKSYTESDKKYVQNLANGLNEALHNDEFPKMIINRKNYGYSLDVFKDCQ